MISRLFAVSLVLLAPALARADEPFALSDGDRVVFYGDSITDQRLYTTFTESFAVTRFPGLKVTFVHSGWGGDRVTGGGGGPIDVRLDRDVIAYKPTVMTIMLGMNDAGYSKFNEKRFDAYANGYRHIVEKVRSEAPGVRLTLIVPSPYDDVTQKPKFDGGYNEVLLKYGEFVKKLAGEAGSSVADLNTSVVAATKRALELDPKNASQLNPDRIHPGPGGQLLMAAALLKAWNAPATVTDVRLTVSGNEAKVAAQNTKVSDVAVKEGVVTWTQLDGALPMPLNVKDRMIALAIKSSDFVSALDSEPLNVEGLSAEKYSLKIDDQDVGTFSKDELAAGLNLATLATPMLRQAMAVHALTLEHNNFHFLRWRQVQVPYQATQPAGVAKAMEGLDGIEAGIIEKQRAAAQPKPHKYELSPKS